MPERYLCKAKKISKSNDNTNDYVVGYYLRRNGFPIIHEFNKTEKSNHIIDINTLSQYTGFKTKTGQLIFEHDFLKSKYGDIGEVKFGLYKNCFDPDGMENYGFYIDWNGRKDEQYYVKNLKYWVEVFDAEIYRKEMEKNV